MNKQKKLKRSQIKIRTSKPTKSIIYLLAHNEFEQFKGKRNNTMFRTRFMDDDL